MRLKRKRGRIRPKRKNGFFSNMKKELLDIIVRDAFVKKQVKLSSGKMSDFYIDVRRVSLNARGLYLISFLIWDMIKNDNVSAVGGLTLGADPIVAGVCMAAAQNGKNLKGFLVRKTPKEHGERRLIEGPDIAAKERVVIVDDVATSGSSVIKAVEAAREAGFEVVKAVVVMDRGEGAQDNMAKLNCPLFSIFTRKDLPL